MRRRCDSGRRYLLPLPRPCRLQHRVRNKVGSQAVAEGGRSRTAFAEGEHKIRRLVNKRVLVSNLQSGNPPVLHIWVVAIRDVDALPPTQVALVAIVEVLQAMQIVQVPRGRRLFTVNLQSEQRLVPSRIAGCFKQRSRAIGKSTKKRACVVDLDWLHLSR